MNKSDLARELVDRYIEIGIRNNTQFSKRFLATVLQKENPEVFKEVENARSIIRSVLDANGSNFKSDSRKELARRFTLIPEAIRETRNTEPFTVAKTIKKTLWLADIHGRFYDREALEIAINYGIQHKCDSVVINGDFLDFYQFSKFDKNPSISIIFEEQEWGQDVLKLLQDTFGYVVCKEGNHDARRAAYIARLSASMPELMDMSKYSDYLFYEGCNVYFIEDYRHIVYGKLNAIHGHEYYGSGGIHVAHNRLGKAFDNVISAHSHVAQSIIRKTINDSILGSWSLACLCDLNPRYAPKNNWNNGFAVTTKSSLGEFEVDNRVIYNKKTYAV